MRTPINNIGIFDEIPAPRYTQQEGETMTVITPLALKLRTAYRNSDATNEALWNEMAEVVEDELVVPRPVCLPTVEEARQAIADRYEAAGGYNAGDYWDWYASIVLDLVASRVRHWVPVEPGTLIKAGTHYRIECGDGRANEYVASCDRKTDESVPVYIDPATVPAEPEDPRIKRAHAIIPALQRVKNVPLGGDLLPAALEAIDALEATL